IATGTAAILAFTDDDVRVARNWVSEIVSAFERYPDADFVGGKVLPRWPAPPPKWLTPAHWGALALTDFGDTPFVVDARKPLCLIGASLACRRRLFDAIGMFDPRFQHKPGTVSSVEDYDLELRAWRVGRRGIYVPSVVVTADVQPERLGKRYHRRWHRDHGRLFPTLLRPGEGFASDGALITLPARDRRLFGVPLWMLRRTGSLAWAFVRAAFARRPDRAFELEGALIEHLATISTSRGGIN
ncbi:MAG TPA: glycosyltransferase family 2 protein, partial [Gemmatimonadaceae bacterium]